MATYHIIYNDVRGALGWSSTMLPDTDLDLAMYLPAGDAWIDKIITDNGESDFDSLSSAKKSLCRGAEACYVASIAVKRALRHNFKAGPFESKNLSAKDLTDLSKSLYKDALDYLDRAGLAVEIHKASSRGGDDYHPEGDDRTQIDLGLAGQDSDYPFNIMGVDDHAD